MPLDLPDGTACFVDANVFYYALIPTVEVSEHCVRLMDYALAGKVALCASVGVLSDTLHKVMMTEVAAIAGRERAGIVGFLGKHPEIIGRLIQYPRAAERLNLVPMRLLEVDDRLLIETTQIAVEQCLLTNDAMIVALMRRHKLTHLVTNDDDFDKVPNLTVWKPR